MDASDKNKIRFYQLLNYFREKLNSNLQHYKSSLLDYYYLYNKPQTGLFNDSDLALFEELKSLIDADKILSNNIFEFKSKLTLNTFYKKLIEDFFETEPSKLPKGHRNNIKKIISSKIPALGMKTMNLTDPIHSGYDDETIIERYGSLDNYYQGFDDVIKSLKSLPEEK